MTSIFNTRKLDKDFGQGAADMVQLIDSYKGDVADDFLPLNAEKLESKGVLSRDSRGNGWPTTWHINYRYLLDNGYFSKHGEALAAAGEEMQNDYYEAARSKNIGSALALYYAKWGNAAGREYIIVP